MPTTKTKIKTKVNPLSIGQSLVILMANEDLFVKHRVFDLSIEDLQERREMSVVYDNAKEVAYALGVDLPTIKNNRVVGKKVRAKNGKYYAVRKEPNGK